MKKAELKKLCTLSMLTAITVILAIWGTIRVGNAVKIPLKFISVFITGTLFGPVASGVVGFLGDVLNSILVPVGPPLPQIWVMEFIYGYLFGLFLHKNNKNCKKFVINAVICSIILTLLDIFVMSGILINAGYFASFTAAFVARWLASLIKMVLYIIVPILLRRYISFFERLIK